MSTQQSLVITLITVTTNNFAVLFILYYSHTTFACWLHLVTRSPDKAADTESPRQHWWLCRSTSRPPWHSYILHYTQLDYFWSPLLVSKRCFGPSSLDAFLACALGWQQLPLIMKRTRPSKPTAFLKYLIACIGCTCSILLCYIFFCYLFVSIKISCRIIWAATKSDIEIVRIFTR